MQLTGVFLALVVLVVFDISAVLCSCKCHDWVVLGDSLLECAKKCGATKFAAKVKEAGLEKEFNTKQKKTLFAPLDAAFDAVPQSVKTRWNNDKELLKKTLRYHLTGKMYKNSDFTNNMLVPTHYPTADDRMNIYATNASSMTTVNGFTIDGWSNDIKDGNVFRIHGCLYRLPMLTIFDYIATNTSMSLLETLVARADLENQLEGADLTMFAPTNGAFNRLPAGVLADLINNPAKLKDVLRGHVVTGVFYSPGLPNNTVLTTWSGRNITVTTTPGHIKVNNVTVTDANVPAGNGVIHAIDTVLMPAQMVSTNSLVDNSLMDN